MKAIHPRRGMKSPVLVVDSIDWKRDYSAMNVGHLLAMTKSELAAVDPLAMNLIVAKEIPTLASLDIAEYQAIVNAWASDFRSRCLPYWEQFFREAPQDFQNDIRYFRLGMVCQYLDLEVGIAYNRDQRNVKSIQYGNPSDLFLNGILDTKEGTCGNMSALHVAMGWRLGWPVSLACVDSHYICRYDDGETVFNIESTDTGRGGWSAPDDDRLIEREHISARALACGSDLRALTARELLACFIGLRARHTQDLGKIQQNDSLRLLAEQDWLLTRYLFPTQRNFYKNQMGVSAMRGERCFDPDETGHPITFADFLLELYSRHPITAAEYADSIDDPMFDAATVNAIFTSLGS